MSKLGEVKALFSQRPGYLAVLIVISLTLWMMSGGEQAVEQSEDTKLAKVAMVQVQRFSEEPVIDVVSLYARTQANRSVELKAEVKGKVVEILVERGAPVKKGQAIARIEDKDIKQQLNRARAVLDQREIEFNAANSLNKKGLQGEAQLSAAKANLAIAKADIEQLRLDLARTVLKAPFEGVVNERYIEQGDYVKSGDNVAQIADLNPIVLRAFATEHQVQKLALEQKAEVKLLGGSTVTGDVRYIASVADNNTNTFKVEVEVANPELRILAGMSGDVSVILDEQRGIKITPALLALDENGNIGVKSVVDSKVEFTPIQVLKSENDGIWLSGLAADVDVITMGAGFVRAGDPVKVVSAEEVKRMTAEAMAKQTAKITQ